MKGRDVGAGEVVDKGTDVKVNKKSKVTTSTVSDYVILNLSSFQ